VFDAVRRRSEEEGWKVLVQHGVVLLVQRMYDATAGCLRS
jgi:hypothetical protein